MKARVAVRDGVKIRKASESRQGIGVEVRARVSQWPEDLRAMWDERAAIIEFDSGLRRRAAERDAYDMLRSPDEDGDNSRTRH